MLDAPTHADLVELAKAELLAGNSEIDASAVDAEGHPANIIVNTAAALAGEVIRQVVTAERNLYLDTATGEDLDRLVWDRYAITRNGAAASLGTVTFSRVSAAYGAITIAAGTRLRSTAGIEFETLAAVSYGGSTTGSLSARVRSVKAGAGQRAKAGEITAFVTTPADSSITVTNSVGTVGDADGETDAQLAERARRYFENARRGTLAAIEYGALSVPGVRFAVGTEITETNGRPARWVKLQVADRLGESNSALTAAVEAAMDAYSAAGIYVQVLGATINWVTITLALVVKTGFDLDATIAAVKSALVAALDAFEPGQTLYHADLIAAAKSVPGVASATVAAPAAALAATDTQAHRTQLGLITITG